MAKTKYQTKRLPQPDFGLWNDRLTRILCCAIALLFIFSSIGSAAPVEAQKARTVAQNWLRYIVQAYGSWGGAQDPTIIDEETIEVQGQKVAYNFQIFPSGHILVPAVDELPPVKLYSETSDLSLDTGVSREQAEWIAGEVREVEETLAEHAQDFNGVDNAETPNGRLWALFGSTTDFQGNLSESDAATEALEIGPLLTTTWTQENPYNAQCPLESSGCRTIVGCVATAASQIMNYWGKPATGTGSVSYSWFNGATTVTLSRSFSTGAYDWANMPNNLTAGSTAAQKAAVARLCADVGYAWQMDYGCGSSGAVTLYGSTVYTTYFGYKDTIQVVYRSSYGSDSAWMQVFKTEAQAGRPAQLRLRDPSAGGHSVVVDGYRDAPNEQIHLNMGWSGSYDGWYVPNSILTPPYSWSDLNYQAAIIGIEPPSCEPPQPELIAPAGVSADATPTYSWNASSGATWYRLYAKDNAGHMIYTWYRASEVGCASGSGVCSVTPDTAMDGETQWLVLAYSGCGYSPWSDTMNFTVTCIPQTPELIAPSGSTSNTKPTYSWNASSGATWYRLYAKDTVGNKIYTWYRAKELGCASGSGVCSVIPETAMVGETRWWVMAYSGCGYSPWSDAMDFTVTCAPPAPDLIAPSGSISNPKPTYSWNASSGATWYCLYVNDSSGNKVKEWYRASEAGCASGSGVCSINPAVALAKGNGRWWVRAYNDCGYSAWSYGKYFSCAW